MRVSGIRWLARAHGDIHVARKQSRCADGSTSIEIYWGEGRQVSDLYLHSATHDPIFRVLPCPKLGLIFSMSDAGVVPIAQPFLDQSASWDSLFPSASSSLDLLSSLLPRNGLAL